MALDMDPYQAANTKHFHYQYIGPRLVEHVDEQNCSAGTPPTYSDVGGGYVDTMDTGSGTSSCSLVWYIVLIILLLTTFLLIGILSIRGNSA
jgi:hypothetical protein